MFEAMIAAGLPPDRNTVYITIAGIICEPRSGGQSRHPWQPATRGGGQTHRGELLEVVTIGRSSSSSSLLDME